MGNDEKRVGEAPEQYDPPRVEAIPTEDGPAATTAGAVSPPQDTPLP